MTFHRSVFYMKALTERALAAKRSTGAVCAAIPALPILSKELMITAYCSMQWSAKQGFYSIQIDEAPVLKNAEVQTYLRTQGFRVNENGVSWISDHLA